MNASETTTGWVEMTRMGHNDPPRDILTHSPIGAPLGAAEDCVF